ncbi:MAG: hypothetical protein H6741_19460 [Alphaproteobacteria bacterium]|nr:hypothetical protein [Alphaproteobacteria bacterium]
MLLLLALLACDAAADKDAAATPDSAGTTDDSAAAGSVYDATLGQAGLCDPSARQPRPASGPFTDTREPSPFGTGSINSVALGALEDPSAIEQARASGAVNYSLDLDTERYDLYIPAGYDGSEPYGLALFINAGDQGDTPGEWNAAFDAAKLIRIGGEGVGNSTNVDVRMGKTVLAAYRALELFHVDTSRVYATGTSGGARTAMVMSLLHPGLFPAAFPLCGASWFEPLEQSYETHEPDSHYEFWGEFFYPDVNGQPYADYVLPFAQRFAVMTSFDDFREGDLFNIHHHGLIPRGLQARLLETSGGHCSTTAEHVADALAFIEDPLFIEVTENSPWLDASGFGASTSTEEGLSLSPSVTSPAALLSKGRLHWDSRAGATISLTLSPLGPGTRTSLVIAPAQDALAVSDVIAGNTEGWRLRAEGNTLAIDRLSASGATTLAEGALSDWDGLTPLTLTLHLWSEELRLEPVGHFEDTTLAEGARLLDDGRSLRLRFSDLGLSWTEDTWTEEVGAALLLVAEAAGDIAPSAVQVSGLSVKDAAGYACE